MLMPPTLLEAILVTLMSAALARERLDSSKLTSEAMFEAKELSSAHAMCGDHHLLLFLHPQVPIQVRLSAKQLYF